MGRAGVSVCPPRDCPLTLSQGPEPCSGLLVVELPLPLSSGWSHPLPNSLSPESPCPSDTLLQTHPGGPTIGLTSMPSKLLSQSLWVDSESFVQGLPVRQRNVGDWVPQTWLSGMFVLEATCKFLLIKRKTMGHLGLPMKTR